MRTRLILVLAGLAGPAALPAAAQVAVQYTFNDQTANPSTNVTAGSPSVTLVGGTTVTFTTPAPPATNGAASTDPAAAASNFAYNTTTYPAQGTGSGTAGVQFGLPTTSSAGGFSDLVFRFDLRASNTASLFYQLQYATDGTTFQSVGLPNGGLFNAGAPETFTTRTFDLSGVAAAANNPNLAVRVVSVFAPGLQAYSPANTAFITDGNPAGSTNGTQTEYAPGGATLYDMVTLSRAYRYTGASSGDLNSPGSYTLAGSVPAAVPGATDTVLFAAAPGTAVQTLTAAATYGQFVFATGAPAYTVGTAGGPTLTLESGLANQSAATQTFNGPVAFTRSATVENVGTVVFNGPLASGGNTGLQLVGSGGTTVINGAYIGNDIQLSVGHTLAGIGTINNEVHNFGGTVRGGRSDGVNDFGTLTVNAAGDLELYAGQGPQVPAVQIRVNRTGVNTVQNSRIAVTGGGGSDVELNNADGGANRIRFDLLASNLVGSETYEFTFLTTDSTGSIEFNNLPRADGFVFPSASYIVTGADGFASQVRVANVAGGSTLVLTLTPVPEPATVGLAAAAGLAAASAARRRLRTRAAA